MHSRTYARLIIGYLALVLFLVPGVVQAHGGIDFPTGPSSFKEGREIQYTARYVVTEVHKEVHVRICMWHKNANGWHVHEGSCVPGVQFNQKSVGVSARIEVLCPHGQGPWRPRQRGWVVGDNGTVHLEHIMDGSQLTINC